MGELRAGFGAAIFIGLVTAPASALPAPIQNTGTFLLNAAVSLNTPPFEVFGSKLRIPPPLKEPM